MPYIGRSNDKISNIEVLDNITFDGSSSYSITKGSVAFTPNSAQSLLISIDGVVQATNFSVNSSTIDFGVAIPSTSVCNFFLHYGTGVMTVPSDGSVTTAKLGNSAVDLTSKVTGALPVANGGTNLTSGFANGITVADQWRLPADQSVTTSASVLTGWERPDDQESSLDCYGRIGTGMSESSGTFTFPSTGIYLVRIVARSSTASQSAVYVQIRMSKDGSNYDTIGDATHYIENGFTGFTLSEYFCDVTNTSNDLIQFTGRSSAGTNTVVGSTNENITSVTFIRLGDT